MRDMPTEGGEGGPHRSAPARSKPTALFLPTRSPRSYGKGKGRRLQMEPSPLRCGSGIAAVTAAAASIPLARSVVISGLHLPSPVHARLRLLGETARGEAR